MNVLAFAASSSKHSINKQLVNYAARLIEGGLLKDATVKTLDLNDYEMPIYSIGREKADGIPSAAQTFFDEIGRADALLISFAEHNGSYTAAYKNIFDWASRINARVYQDKPTVILSTSIGRRGGANVLATAVGGGPHFGNDIKGSLSIPSFSKNFDSDSGALSNPEIDEAFRQVLATFANNGAA